MAEVKAATSIKEKKVNEIIFPEKSMLSNNEGKMLKMRLSSDINEPSGAKISTPLFKATYIAGRIKKSGVKTIIDLLQQVPGIDIRRRGSDGIQADLYIRGGTFDQTLLLIDEMWMKVRS